MMRLVIFLLGVIALAAGLAWLADRPGNVLITWQDYEIETSVFRATVIATALAGLLLLLVSVVRQIWTGPATVGHYLTRRRHRRGLDALSSGMIAIGAGDRAMATRYAMQARKALPNEPLTHLLRAQAAQLSGDKTTARRIFEAMLAAPDTEQLGLRGLFLEAGREGEREAQRQFADRALRLNPKLSWPVEALFTLQCRNGDWEGALETLATARRYGHIERAEADRRRAVLLTGQAQVLEDSDAEKALTLSLEAHGLAPDLVPAAVIAGRILASRGNTARAAKIVQRTWSKSPHPDLATVYAYARVGDSPRDRLDRVKQLAALTPHSIESSIAAAGAAIEAHDYDEARRSLGHLLENGLTRRVATLMARIEGEQNADRGRVREWLARAASARRDPAWTADGVISDKWAPISPVSGTLDAYQWRVPVEELDGGARDGEAHEFEQLAALGEPEARGAESVPWRADEAVDATEPSAAPSALATPTEDRAARKSMGKESAETLPHARDTHVTQQPKVLEPRTVTDTARKTAPDGSSDKSKGAGERTVKPQIFVAPHAPDDPGAEAGDVDDLGSMPNPFRA